MKKRFFLFLVLLIVIILSLTSCDDIISKIPGIGEKPNAEPEIYTITYVIVYGERTESAQVKRGDTIPKPEDPEREGYIFTGWYANQALGEEINFNSVPLGSFMIFAGWEPLMHTADFDIDEYDQSVAYDAFVQRPEVLPQKDGYYFVDWYADPEYTVLFDFGAPIKGDVKIYAKWHPITYLAEFIVYDENDNPSRYHSITVNYGTAVDAPANPEDRDSGNFLYWRDKNGVAWDFSTPLYDNIVLTAVYSLNRYTIYLANTDMAPIEYNHGDILQGLNEPWKDGFVFDGWYADEELTVKWQFGTPITSDTTIYAKWVEEKAPSGDTEVKNTTIYLVGDSTVCSFADDYLYPRYGWGTQLGNYLTDKATVVNLAISGRSSKSFITENNYQTLLSNIKEGDYLLIAFGHNDQKSDDPSRFTYANKDYKDETSFGYYLYNYYIKVAKEKGATPILVTPIVRAKSNNDYSGSEGHVTATGDYRQAIIDLSVAVGVDVIDMTTITRARYEAVGYSEALKYHAILQGKYDTDGITVVENWSSADKTHLNIYGARYVAYNIAVELAKLNGIKNYVAEGITEPSEADRVANPNYVVPDYTSPDLENYTPASQFTTTTDGWYGTAFGNTGGNPQSTSNQYIAKETSTGVFQVGTPKSDKGKFDGSSDGFAFLFTQVDASKNFKVTVNAKIISVSAKSQAGFGLMLRDDCYIDQTASFTLSTNYLTAGILAQSTSKMGMNFYRENGTLNKGEGVNGFWSVDDTFTLTIERIGQTVNVTVVYNGTTYTESYYDFDLFAKDGDYMYVGMFANRGTVVEFTSLDFTITGESQGA